MQADHFVDVHPDDPMWGHAYALDADGLRLHYVRQGQGQPVVLLHGWPGFWYDWRRVIPRVAEHADVIALDFRGFGDSDKPDWPPQEAYSPDAQARNVLTLLDHLKVDAAILVGYDIGSRVAQAVARKAPERVRSLVLSAPAYPGFGARRLEWTAQREFWYQHFHNIQQADQLIGYSRETVRLYLQYFYDHWVGRKEAVRPKEFEAIVDIYARPGAVRGSIAWYRSGAGTGSGQALHDAKDTDASLQIVHPTTILWGEVDPIFPPSWSDRLQEYFTHLTFHLLPGVGHFVPFEAPEAIVDAIEAALREA